LPHAKAAKVANDDETMQHGYRASVRERDQGIEFYASIAQWRCFFAAFATFA